MFADHAFVRSLLTDSCHVPRLVWLRETRISAEALPLPILMAVQRHEFPCVPKAEKVRKNNRGPILARP